MSIKKWIYVVGIFLMVILLSCAKLPEAPTGENIGLKMDVLPLSNTIPLAWGELIAVNNTNTTWVQLWFKDKEGNIYTVPYNIEKNVFGQNYRCIKQR